MTTYSKCCCKIPGQKVCPFCNPNTRRMLEEVERRDYGRYGYRVFSPVEGSIGISGDFRHAIPQPQRHATTNLEVKSHASRPNGSPYAWMGPSLQKFYEHQDRKRKLDKELLTIDPNSTFGRKLKCEREAELCAQDLALMDNRERKAELHERWMRKDPWAAYPVYRDLALYPKKSAEKRREKDCWASYRLL